MKIQVMNWDDAITVAQLMKEATEASKAAAVGIEIFDVLEPNPKSEFWAVSGPDALDEIQGHVDQIRLV